MKYPSIYPVFKRDHYNRIIRGNYYIPEFELLANTEWKFFEKIDGTNIRVKWDSEKKKYSLSGRTDNAQLPPALVEETLAKFEGKEIFPTNNAIFFGEGIGEGINGKNKYKVGYYDFVLFDILVENLWLEYTSVFDIAEQIGLSRAPLVGSGTLQDAIDMVEQRKFTASFNPSVFPEGIIAKHSPLLLRRNGERVITKIKFKDFVPMPNNYK